MTNRKARTSLLVTAVLAGAVVAAPVGVAAPGVAASGAVGPAGGGVAGDKVTVGGMYGATVRAAKGREHVSFFSRKDEQGDLHVIPEDAVALVEQGKLDSRLFDVTELVRSGYDDASRDRLPLIVDYPGNTPRVASAEVSRELPVVSAAAVSVERTADFWATARNAEHVWLDGPVRASLDYSVPQIGAPEAWAAGHTGAGATVAVLDTGVDATHPDLSDAVAGAQNFTPSDTTDDRFGHGTHVASTITGKGDKYKGVAPDAKLLNGKVLDDFGGGMESWIIAGMEWAANSGADVINMSLGSRFPSDGTDPMSQALNRITAATGTLFVVAAGNSGDLVGSPAAADAALTVGAVDRNDQLAEFSSRGRIDGAIKPDITAPGVDIVAAKAKNGFIGDPAGDGYVSLSGTSMATPHVAGAAAILVGKNPRWGAAQLKPALMSTAQPSAALSVFEQGAGRVDVAKASKAKVLASPASISNGVVQWPHNDDQPIAKTITYTNTGSAPITLDLTTQVTGPDGSPAPQGMFTVTPPTLRVPAYGQATATVTTDTRVDATDGVYSGLVTGTVAGETVRTVIVVNREVESYNVTVKTVDHNGAPTDVYSYELVDVNNPEVYGEYDPSGTAVVRVPKGEFYLHGSVLTSVDGWSYRIATFAEPGFTVTGDTEVVLDARQGKQVSVTVDKPNARVGGGLFEFAMKTAWGEVSFGTYFQNLDNHDLRPSTTSSKDKFTFTTQAELAEWNGTSFHGSPYIYHLRHPEDGAVPSTLRWRFRDFQFAKVRSEHAMATPGAIGRREGFVTMSLPATLTEYYTPKVPWESYFMEETTAPVLYPVVTHVYQIEPRSFPFGQTTTERWNVGVFGPAFPNSRDVGWYHASRVDDELSFDLGLAADQGRGRMGFGSGEGTTTLLRDGQVIGEFPYAGSGYFQVGPERAEYTVRAFADQSGLARLSTQISAEWKFTSEHVAGDRALVPLLAVRFAPNLDNQNAAPAGQRFTIPVYVQRNGSADTGNVNTPVVAVSYDDGVTWRPASVTADGAQWVATVDHPVGPQFVSLRSTISDPDGNTQRQTIIRAYALG